MKRIHSPKVLLLRLRVSLQPCGTGINYRIPCFVEKALKKSIKWGEKAGDKYWWHWMRIMRIRLKRVRWFASKIRRVKTCEGPNGGWVFPSRHQAHISFMVYANMCSLPLMHNKNYITRVDRSRKESSFLWPDTARIRCEWFAKEMVFWASESRLESR